MWSRAELSAYHVIRELLPQRPPLPPNLQMHDSSGSRIPNGWHTSTRTRSKCRCRCTLSLQWAAIVDITALALMPLCCCCFYCNRALVKNVNLKTYWPRERKREQRRERKRQSVGEYGVMEDNNVPLLLLLLLSLVSMFMQFLGVLLLWLFTLLRMRFYVSVCVCVCRWIPHDALLGS